MTKSSVSFSGWFFLSPTGTDVVLVHLRLELPTTDDDTNDVDDIQSRPCATRLSPPRLAHKVADHIPSPTPRSRTNSLFDSGSPHRSPSIDDLKPNAHPYPIRTTSTALLTRSNSTSSQQQNGGRHHYVPPPSPHPSPHRERTSSNASASGDGNGGGSTGKAGGERKGEYRGHRYSRSLSSSEGMAYGGVAAESPRALPVPPGFDTTPDNKGITTSISPKRWTPAQLAAYLGGEAGAWTARRGVGGRAFMRMGEEELGRLGYVFSSSIPDFIHPSTLTVSPSLLPHVFFPVP
ncbi:hypothetical protein C8J57DRAFT_1503167 [Mycena rebaudengoi]|nr:hypothetical protein C8J57DRAFT_1503167 [Mycena rebaudengoi]